jgi:alpha-glucosidase
MHLITRLMLAFTLCIMVTDIVIAKDYPLSSPDKKIQLTISVNKDIRWSITYNGENILQPSAIALALTNGMQLGINPSVVKAIPRSVNQTITSVVPVRNRIIPEVYNELSLQLKGNYIITFRAYNDGVAYRFETSLPDNTIEVKDETADFNLGGNYHVYWPQEKDPNFQSHYEAVFADTVVSAISNQQYGYLPITLTTPKGTNMVITEADLYDYPNLFLFGTGGPHLTATFPHVNLETKEVGDRGLQIIRKADYIAKTSGKRTFPWRTVIISADDKGLLETDLVYKLSTANALPQTDWIKPGKVSWDWWNDWNIYGVDFKSGINTDTYKYYIDFASDYGLQYIILDEGWSAATNNIMEPTKDLDIEALVKYGNSKNVSVILWALWNVLDKNVDGILDRYVQWGVKGIKVDFMARADQEMVNFYERVAKAAAARHLLVDYHGAYKPSGLNRKYPNVINFEGVRGLENDKWSEVTPTHDVTLPFTRMVAGPMDFTPGAMVNAAKGNFRSVSGQPMSEGTRAHQVAMYVVYDAPLQMLADNPSNYRKDSACTKFISRIPTTWDKTVGLAAKSGQYVAVAKKNGDSWYIGCMTNWDPRTLDLPLNFLDGKRYRVEIVQDGVNADRYGSDYKLTTKEVTSSDTLQVQMAPGGGWAAILVPVGG